MRLLGKDVFYGWWIVFASFLLLSMASGFFLFGMSRFFLEFRDELAGGKAGPIAWVLGAASIEGAILGPLQGYFTDRHGPKPVMLVGIVAVGVGLILISTAHSLGVFFVFYLLAVAGNGQGLISAPLATVGNWFVRKRGLAFGIAMSGFSLGTSLVLLSNYLINEYGWRTASTVQGIVALAVGIPLALTMRHRPENYGLLPDGDQQPTVQGARPRGREQPEFTAREALRTQAFWLLTAGFTLRSLVMGALAIHFIPMLVDKGYSKDTASMLLVVYGVMNVPGRLVLGPLSDRINSKMVLGMTVALIPVALLTLVWADSLWQILLFLVIYAVAMGGSATTAFAVRSEYFGRKAFATISGFTATFQGGFSAVATGSAGRIHDATGEYDAVIYVFAALGAIGAAVIFLARRPVLRQRSARAPPP